MRLLSEMVDKYGEYGSSDLQITSNRGAYHVKDKATRKIKAFPHAGEDLINDLLAEVVDNGMAEFEKEGQIGASFDRGGLYRGRLAVRKELGGKSCTMRIISRHIPTVEELGLPAAVVNLVGRPSGLILLVGETGSGKSTSIAAMTNLVNLTQESSIYTLESPIEYVYPEGKSFVIQREIGLHVESFAKGVENAKRSHPRIIVIGEILNAVTARSALLAATSGHLVVSTMHAGTAAEAVDSFVSMFTPEEQGLIRTQLAQSLLGIVAQTLVPKPLGGMALAQEIAFNTPSFAELLRGSGNRSNDTKYIQQLLLGSQGKADNMVSMEESLAKLVKDKEITLRSGYSAARDTTAFEQKLTVLGVPLKPAAA
jgi:twitching motility protein PilT